MRKGLCFLYIIVLLMSLSKAVAHTAEPNESAEFVPEWAKHAIWYQIFPERFRNGDPSNDPTMASIAGADPAEPATSWRVHPWGSDWYERLDYEQQNGEPELWKHMLRRRYGGDLQGIIDQLDYLQQLGINAIYLNPVFQAPSLHKYDSSSLHHIDPYFGPDPQGDLALIATEDPLKPQNWVWTAADKLALKLISEAHAKGIRIIFDGVFNHMGITNFAFVDLKKRQQASPFKDWFDVISFDDAKAGTSFEYKGWFGVQSLPEFKEDESGLVSGPRDYVFAATQRWMNPMGKGKEFGIDGWRLDVAFCIAHPFWKDWRKLVKSLNPQAYLTAEIVETPENVLPYLLGDEFDGEMNYNFAFAVAEFLFNQPETAITATEFDKKLAYLRNIYPKGVPYVVQNLFDSHDSNRLASHIVNQGKTNFRDWPNYHLQSQVSQNPNYLVRKPNEQERQLQKLFVLLQMTYVGAPMIYYGDEVGMWGANDPGNRKPMLWSDIKYQDEQYMPDGSKRPADKVAADKTLLTHYQQLIAIRQASSALRIGSYQTLLADDDSEIFAFARQHNDETVWVLLNKTQQVKTVTLPAGTWQQAQSLLNSDVSQVNNGKFRIELQPRSGEILNLSSGQ
jgi:cyclomaltodextrinase / maltogenic alpha-amylase / neopullulanase